MKREEKMGSPILSLCIPTNGISDWVFPVLDSIYLNDPDECNFEVIVEDNGNCEEFEKRVWEYQKDHQNIKYYKSSAIGFLCQIDCFKHANGDFIKFVNHRARLVSGALEYLIGFAEENQHDKPVVFFSNGQLSTLECKTFEEFVLNLQYWSSWSGGLAFWKEDIELIANIDSFNCMFPHIDMLFIRRNAVKYIVDDREIFSEINAGHGAKGKYNLFKTFSVEYLSIINDLLRNNEITVDTFLSIKNSLLDFLANQYIDFIIRKKPASYSFDKYHEYLSVYYSRRDVRMRVIKRIISRLKRKIVRL